MTATVLIGIGHGGTGQITAPAAFQALSPMSAKGDIIIADTATTSASLSLGSVGTVLGVDSVSLLPSYKPSLYGTTGLGTAKSLIWIDALGNPTAVVPPTAGSMVSPMLTLDSVTNIPTWIDAGT